MDITIKDEGARFGVRVSAIIFNADRTKILLENQNGRYMFPGGRISVHEDSDYAIIRELKEELDLDVTLNLKYILEMFLQSPRTQYHEIGFYYIGVINEDRIMSGFKSLDGDGIFEWAMISSLNDYNILAKPIRDKVVSGINDECLEHLIYREY